MGTQESTRMDNLREDVNEALAILGRYGITEPEAYQQATGCPLPMPEPGELEASKLQSIIDLAAYHQAVDEAGWKRQRDHVGFVAAFRGFTELTWQSGGRTHAGALFDEQYDAAAEGRAVETIEQTDEGDLATLEQIAAEHAAATRDD